MLELNHLRCFVAVARELNFRKAAEQLHMTQPPLSRQIKLLETTLGVRLLERTKHSVRLTTTGRTFLAQATALLEQARQAELAVRKSSSGEVGSVSVGFVASAVHDLLPTIVREMGSSRRGIDIVLREMTTLEQLDALASRRIDVGVVRAKVEQPAIRSELFIKEPFVLAVPAGHALSRRKTVSLTRLQGQPFIMYSQSGWQPFHDLLVAAFRDSGVAPDIVQNINSTLSILSLVRAGLGLALVPRSTSSMGFSGVRFCNIDPRQGLTSELFLAWRADNDNPAFPAVLDLIRKYRHSPSGG